MKECEQRVQLKGNLFKNHHCAGCAVYRIFFTSDQIAVFKCSASEHQIAETFAFFLINCFPNLLSVTTFLSPADLERHAEPEE